MPPISTAHPEIDQRPMTQRLREGCWDLHQAAEGGDFAGRMARGELPIDAYLAMLQSLYQPMRTLDERLVARRGSIDAIDALLTDDQMHARHIAADLGHFGVQPEPHAPGSASAALTELIERTDAEDPVALIGLHYVREGANNGNRFVAIKLRKTLGLEGGAGTRFLDPYADRQRAAWDAFKKTLDRQTFRPEQRDAIVGAAREMFRAIIGVHRELTDAFPSNTGV